MEVKVFKNPKLSHPLTDIYAKEIKNLKSDKNYKSCLLGKDADFGTPPNAKLADVRHFHITKHYASDSYVIYCSGFTNANYYLLIDVIEEDAHKKCWSMTKYIEVAEKFRAKY
ncbi:type II toxin-antitoxin system YafO family toxin [Saccharobesus litoralis]|uniref:type II toxin-antitoxin system YafO family toxin n=1 Tax=Saccharobesus litoralis TaxID=2172099 RepID=UPI00131F28EA|nr:type II toxin-antitoxin system YafO family toxin [Saccharobesus litoralis]